MLTAPRRTAAAAVVSALVLCAGCSSPEESGQGEETEPRSKIIQPGRPGEGNETLGPDATVDAAPANDDDVMFMQMMVPHHAQALEMSELAETRARDEQVVAIARRIQGAQGPEITAMAGWLQSRGLEVPETEDDLEGEGGAGGHGMDMPGMLTDRQLAELEAARGAEFDRLFLAGMIRHHQGAVDMANAEMASGSEILALELAGDIATGQLAEIRRMQDVRTQL